MSLGWSLNHVCYHFSLKSVPKCFNIIWKLSYFFFYLGFPFTWHSPFAGQQGKGKAISNSFLPLPPTSQTNISWAITAESSPLHIANDRTESGNFHFLAQAANLYATRYQIPICMLSFGEYRLRDPSQVLLEI